MLLDHCEIDCDLQRLAPDLAVTAAPNTGVSDTQCDVCRWWVPSTHEHNCEARQLATKAEALEKAGDAMAAMELYAKAIKMDPTLEAML